METLKWELREKYDAQDVKYLEIQARYNRAVIDAGTRLADLKAQLEALLREEFRTGNDMSAEKAKLRSRIEEAEKAKATAELERAQAYDYTREASAEGRITIRDLVLDWNRSYTKAVREAEFIPIQERMTAARDAYYNAVLDYYEFMERYSPLYSDLRYMNNQDNENHPGNHASVAEIANRSELPMVIEKDLYYIGERKELPNGIKRSKGGDAK